MPKKNVIENNETMYNAKALVYLKYGGERIAPGTVFKVKESHIRELKDKGCAEIQEVADSSDDNTKGTEDSDATNTESKDNEKAGA